MKPIDVSVAVDQNLPPYPGSTPFMNLRNVEPGIYERTCLSLKIVGAAGAPARDILRAG